MITNPAFLLAICDRPDDDTPRLVYADWLEDNGDPERAELIRVQCALAGNNNVNVEGKNEQQLRAREMELLQQHGRRWLAESGLSDKDLEKEDIHLEAAKDQSGGINATPRYGKSRHRATLTFCRGMVEGAELSSIDYFSGESRDKLFSNPIRKLHLYFGINNEEARLVFASDALRNVTDLTLENSHLGPEGARILANSGHLKNLELFRVYVSSIGDEGLGYIAAGSHNLPQLTSLCLRHSEIGEAGARALAFSPLLDGLSRLELAGNQIGNLGSGFLLQSSRIKDIRVLDLSTTDIDDDSAILLANCPYLENLTRLDIDSTRIGERGILALRNSPHLMKLEQLVLGRRYHSLGDEVTLLEHPIGNDGLLALAAWVVERETGKDPKLSVYSPDDGELRDEINAAIIEQREQAASHTGNPRNQPGRGGGRNRGGD